MLKKYYKYILALIIVAVVSVILPIFNIISSDNFNWRDPWAITIHSGGYYMARLHEIKDGNIFLGNPYFIEHSQEMAPAFFVADWIAYLPALFGLSLSYSAVFNLFFWAIIFLLLSFYIFIKLGIEKNISALGGILVYLLGYNLIIDPVSMQTIYPFYLLVFLAFYLWLENTASGQKQLFLIFSLTACFYIYTYLWQIALTACFLFLIYFFLAKRKKELVILLKILAAVFFLSTPLFIYTYNQVTHPLYWETMRRIGLVNTHWPTAEAFYSGKWVLLSLALWLWPKFLNKNLASSGRYGLLSTYFSLTGLSLFIVSLSNVITGKDLELAQHIVRFIKVWLGFSLIAFIYFIFENFSYFKLSKIEFKKQIVAWILLAMVIFGAAGYSAWPRLNEYSSQLESDKQIHSALAWLEKEEAKPVVVMADYKSEMNKDIPILTKHYVLFSAAGILHLLSDEEAEERYLLNGVINNISLNDIKNDYPLFAGNGNAVHPYKTHNRRVKICKIFYLNMLNYDCGRLTDAVSFKGESYFSGLYDQYRKEITPNIYQELKKFKVLYILIDKADIMNLGVLENRIKEVYQNQKFIIYKVL